MSATALGKLRRGAIGLLVFAVALEAVTRAHIVDPTFLPPFSSMLAETVQIFGRADFREGVVATLEAWAASLGLAALVGIGLGVLLGLSEPSYRASRALVELIRPIPAVALIPLVLLVLGQGQATKIAIAFYASLWPILFNTIYGVHGVDPKAKEMARSFGQSRVAIIRRIVLPGAAPFVATGVRLSSSVALIVVITVELIAGSTAGLGDFIAQARAVGSQVTVVYAGTVIAGVLGLVINLAFGILERRWFGWQATGAPR